MVTVEIHSSGWNIWWKGQLLLVQSTNLAFLGELKGEMIYEMCSLAQAMFQYVLIQTPKYICGWNLTLPLWWSIVVAASCQGLLFFSQKKKKKKVRFSVRSNANTLTSVVIKRKIFKNIKYRVQILLQAALFRRTLLFHFWTWRHCRCQVLSLQWFLLRVAPWKGMCCLSTNLVKRR